jgi:hypothetical protein
MLEFDLLNLLVLNHWSQRLGLPFNLCYQVENNGQNLTMMSLGEFNKIMKRLLKNQIAIWEIWREYPSSVTSVSQISRHRRVRCAKQYNLVDD